MSAILFDFTVNLISQLGYFGVFVLMFGEALLIPFPSEITMLFSGFLTVTGEFNPFIVLVVAIVANMSGTIVAYYIGHHIKKLVLRHFIEKYGKFIFITKGEFEKSQDILHKHGAWIILLTRITPGMRALISIPAGAAKYPFPKFLLLSFLGSLSWIIAALFLGRVLGANWDLARSYFVKFDLLIISILLLLLAVYIFRKLRH